MEVRTVENTLGSYNVTQVHTGCQDDESAAVMAASDEKHFFVVQMCWFSGPHVFDPVDYQNLLPTLQDATNLAHQSAMLFSRACRQPVRSLQMHQTIGFSVGGALFWIRSVRVWQGGVGDENVTIGRRDVAGTFAIGSGDSRRRVQARRYDDTFAVFLGSGALAASQQAIEAIGDAELVGLSLPVANSSEVNPNAWPRTSLFDFTQFLLAEKSSSDTKRKIETDCAPASDSGPTKRRI